MASESAIPANGPGKVLFEYGRRECLVFVGGDPNFDGDELPVSLSFLSVPVTANCRGAAVTNIDGRAGREPSLSDA